jgi:hypothetical protein
MIFEHVYAPDAAESTEEEVNGAREFGFWETLKALVEPGGLRELSEEINRATEEVEMLF